MDTLTANTLHPEKTEEYLPLNGTDFIELYVGNAKQSAHYYKTAFGFQSLAYSGLETGNRACASYVLRQGKITLVLTTAYHSDNPVAEHVRRHGDGVKVIAFQVDDAAASFEATVSHGAEAFMYPEMKTDADGSVVIAGIKTYGEVVHLFIQRNEYKGIFLPGFVAWESDYQPTPIGLEYVDHCVGNVGLGRMNVWAKFYEEVMGFKNLITFDDKDISTEYTALMSKVMANDNMRIKFPINEPASGKKVSQVQEYLDFYEGEGCQHIAVATNDIIFTVGELRKRGVEFLYVPGTYYDTVLQRVGEIKEDLNILKGLGIMVDRDEEGYLLQIFTKPVEDRPTMFFEIIQRVGARSFGKGNFQALFESIEEEQRKRGTL